LALLPCQVRPSSVPCDRHLFRVIPTGVVVLLVKRHTSRLKDNFFLVLFIRLRIPGDNTITWPTTQVICCYLATSLTLHLVAIVYIYFQATILSCVAQI
jgi:hypothetical protein